MITGIPKRGNFVLFCHLLTSSISFPLLLLLLFIHRLLFCLACISCSIMYVKLVFVGEVCARECVLRSNTKRVFLFTWGSWCEDMSYISWPQVASRLAAVNPRSSEHLKELFEKAFPGEIAAVKIVMRNKKLKKRWKEKERVFHFQYDREEKTGREQLRGH